MVFLKFWFRYPLSLEKVNRKFFSLFKIDNRGYFPLCYSERGQLINVVNRDLNKVSLERTPEVPLRFKIYQKCTTLSTIRNSESPSVKIIFYFQYKTNWNKSEPHKKSTLYFLCHVLQCFLVCTSMFTCVCTRTLTSVCAAMFTCMYYNVYVYVLNCSLVCTATYTCMYYTVYTCMYYTVYTCMF